MTKFAMIMLAKLLAIAPPGQTSLSQTPIPVCDIECQQTPQCDNRHHWRCKVPSFSKDLYYLHYSKLVKSGMEEEEASEKARLKAFTRAETYEEGFVRYAIIARAIDEVSKQSTYGLCTKKCTDNSCKEKCKQTALWRGSRENLAHIMLVVINQESGQRSDVHGGTGTYGRGDCVWKNAKGKVVPAFTKKAYPVPGTCQSIGLGQRKLGKGKTIEGWTADDIVGLDLKHTKRSLTVMARGLSKARNICTRWGRKTVKRLPKAVFSAYGSGVSCRVSQSRRKKMDGKMHMQYAYAVPKENGKGIKIEWSTAPPSNAIDKEPIEHGGFIRRERIYNKYRNSYFKLGADEIALLSLPKIKKAIELLENSEEQILWMPSIKE